MKFNHQSEFRYSPHNCTVCGNFEGGLEFLSDTRPEMSGCYDVIWIDCKVLGKKYHNNFLLVCYDFEYDDSKNSLVYDPDNRRDGRRRQYVKIKKNDSSCLESYIYDLVCRVQEIDPRGYMMQVCVQRVHLQLGVSGEVVFREVMRMAGAGLLVRESIGGAVFLRPPSPVLNTGDIVKKRKVKI